LRVKEFERWLLSARRGPADWSAEKFFEFLFLGKINDAAAVVTATGVRITMD